MKVTEEIISELKRVYLNKKTFLHEPLFSNKAKKFLKHCIDVNHVSTFSSGKEDFLSKFNKKLISITRAKKISLVINGTSALHLCIKALGLNFNHEVILSNLNYISCPNSLIYENVSPIFLDIDKESLALSPKKLSEFLKKNTKIKNGKCINLKTKKIIAAIVVTHIFGNPAKIQELVRISRLYKLKIIEDASEALGSYYNKKHLGTFGDLGVLSFNGNKIITSGNGGAVLTNDLNYYKKIELISKQAKIPHQWESNYSELGYNYKLSNINAALGYSQILDFKKILKKKKELYKSYKKLFKTSNQFSLVEPIKNGSSNHWLNTIILNTNNYEILNKTLKIMNENNIQCRPCWGLMSDQKYLKKFQFDDNKISRNIVRKLISIPSSPNLKLKN